MEYTWLGIAAAILLLVSCVIGYRRGFIKEAISICFVLLPLVLVWIAQPYVNSFLQEYTPVYDMLEESSESYIQKQIDSTGISDLSVQSIVEEALPLPENTRDLFLKNVELDDTALIDTASYARAIAQKVADILVNALSFLVTYLVISIILRIAAKLLNLVSHLPIIRNVNHFAGLFLGGIKGLLVIWIILVVLTIACNSPWGQQCMEMVDHDTFLRALYSADPFIRICMNAI